MGRPMVRTEVIDEDQMALLQSIFGSASNAWNNLGGYLGEKRVSWWMFQRAFSGRGVEGKVVVAIQSSLDRWITDVQVAIKAGKRPELVGGD